jgi:hypothetical protein
MNAGPFPFMLPSRGRREKPYARQGYQPCVPELSLLYWLPKCSCSGAKLSEERELRGGGIFLGLAQRLRTDPTFLADPMREIRNSGILLDDDAADRLKMAVCAQDFRALKSVINPAFGGKSN